MFSILNLQSLLGLLVVVAACWGLSENRRAFPWRLTLGAIAVQAGLVLALFAIPGSQGGRNRRRRMWRRWASTPEAVP